ncbi:ubiquinol-cytochrome c reductase [Marinobacterium nitratireducens]|uniref:Ubiquinol-cytochrome c reductase n=1 Tax=Marinobacterium nitratireducens TaxID=518897 RepID=A0A917ZHJ0_9GAMM|nr:AarF/ABC1/UbiB kinase family protein [Marinobacterium nitratireducens]GGO83358.1 ubiquinol-cytochrome c reductase [Marinobacterium nitratireducens]
MSQTNRAKAARVPQSRLSRLAGLGSLAGGIAGNLLVEGGRQLVRGERPELMNLLLTPGNMSRLADRLARMRGAAMKVGQLLSMDAGTVLPPELAQVLARLQADAEFMPQAQLFSVLEANWGKDWEQDFSRFSFRPIAAASIGQVHEARTVDAEHLAVKVQYPGVRRSIDSDIDNVCSLLRMSGLLPAELDVAPLIEEARLQLKREADYRREGEQLSAYGEMLSRFRNRDRVRLPLYHAKRSTADILCMSFMQGQPLEARVRHRSDEADRLMTLLLDLFFAELLEFQSVQTDPNPANYRVDTESGDLILLDFGAVRAFSPAFVRGYRRAIEAAVSEDRRALREALEALGFFHRGSEVANLDVVLDIFVLAAEPLRSPGAYDFGSSDLARRIQSRGMSVSRDPAAWHTPPADVLFLHRKMGGLYLLASRLGARVDVGRLFQHY